MAKDPSYPMYAQDFDMDTADWGIDEIGVYIRLLNYEWINGYIPSNLDRISKIARISPRKLQKIWEIIEKKFSQNGTHTLQNRRMEEEREKRGTYRASQSISGMKGATGKWGDSAKNGRTRAERLRIAREKGTHTKEEFQKMVNYFNGICVKCGESEDGVFRDHIIPIYQGGSDGIDNLQPLCRKCNTGKGPENVDYRPIYCKNNNLKMPGEWLKTSGETSGERIALHLQSSSSISLKNKKKVKKKKDPPPIKEKYLEFVFFTKEEKSKLDERYGSKVGDMIEVLNNYIGQSGKKYKSHYHAMLGWVAKEVISDEEAGSGWLEKHREKKRVEGENG